MMKRSPFELNEANNYYWNKQGKRHYWGIKGKDYGLLDSLNNNRPNIEKADCLDFLKYKHINLSQNQYNERISHRNSEEKDNFRVQNIERPFLEGGTLSRNQYTSEKPSNLNKIKTEPAQYHEQLKRYAEDNSDHKKRQLSLMSKNIEISNRQTPKVAENSKRFTTLDYADEKERQLQEAIKKVHRRVNTQPNINDFQMNKYRERIVKVVKRDRKNNPTFCNSLAYPLHCYRYVQ